MDAEARQNAFCHPFTLSKENKDELLGECYQEALDGHPKAVQTLNRLRELNYHVAKQFSLKRSALDNLIFRLVVTEDEPLRVPSYLIVSYCWHHSTQWKPVDPEVLPLWEISPLMVEAILKLRESPQEGVWIDRACIDQTSPAEKADAIGCMGFIYKAARRLVIPLEDVQLTREEEIEGIRCAHIYRDAVNNYLGGDLFAEIQERFFPTDEEYVTLLSFLEKMVSARWTQRAWCSHEIRVQTVGRRFRAVFLVFGSQLKVLQFDFGMIACFSKYLITTDRHKSSPLDPGDPPYVFARPTSKGTSQHLQQKWRRQDLRYRFSSLLLDSAPRPLISQLQETFNYSCEKTVDNISIALNVRGVGLFFNGSAMSEDECYWIMTAVSIAEGDTTPLTLTGRKLRLGASEGSCSWAQRVQMEVLQARVSAPSMLTVRLLTPEFIVLDLLLFQHAPQLPLHRSVQEAMRIIRVSSLKPHVEPDSTKLHRYRDLLQDRLACSIENGLDFLRGYAGTVEEHEKYWHGYYGPLPAPGPTHETATLEVLQFLGVTEDSVANFREDYFDPVVQFFIRLVHPRFYFPIVRSRCLKSSHGHTAVVNSVWASFWFAVPVALAGVSFERDRVWLLEPYSPGDERLTGLQDDSEVFKGLGINPEHGKGYDEERGENPPGTMLNGRGLLFDFGDDRASLNDAGAWRLMAKAQMLGCPTITADGESVKLLRAQRVFG